MWPQFEKLHMLVFLLDSANSYHIDFLPKSSEGWRKIAKAAQGDFCRFEFFLRKIFSIRYMFEKTNTKFPFGRIIRSTSRPLPFSQRKLISKENFQFTNRVFFLLRKLTMALRVHCNLLRAFHNIKKALPLWLGCQRVVGMNQDFITKNRFFGILFGTFCFGDFFATRLPFSFVTEVNRIFSRFFWGSFERQSVLSNSLSYIFEKK